MQYNDLKTGKLLEKPIVHTYIVNDKEDTIKAPLISSRITEDGFLEVSWEKVENATKYYIINNTYYINEYIPDEIQHESSIIGETTDTKWISNEKDRENLVVNNSIRSINVKDEDTEYYSVKNNIKSSIDVANDKDLPFDPSNITVIATNGTDYSKISNAIQTSSIFSNLTHKIARNIWEDKLSNTKQAFIYDSVEQLPPHAAVSMVNGKVKFIPYEIEMDKVGINKVGKLIIPIKIKGSNLRDTLVIETPPADYKEKITAFNEKLTKSALNGTTEFDFKQVSEINLKSKVVSDKLPEVKDQVFATTAMGHFIAANLIDNVDIIDLKDFPNNGDRASLWDTVKEAYSQNPTVAYVENISVSRDGRYLEIVYVEKDRETRIRKQNEIREKLDKVAEDIKKSTSDPIEQLRKINNYICENGEYDFEALAKFKEVISQKLSTKPLVRQYEDVFTTYGIAVKNKGVCASYANSFNYLAKKVGLESIYVTGYIQGNTDTGHAWNAVKLNNEWRYFDSTWNDGNPNAREKYFNLKMEDQAFAETHSLKDDYILKTNIDNYKNK